jgi:hypothetical protein
MNSRSVKLFGLAVEHVSLALGRSASPTDVNVNDTTKTKSQQPRASRAKLLDGRHAPLRAASSIAVQPARRAAPGRDSRRIDHQLVAVEGSRLARFLRRHFVLAQILVRKLGEHLELDRHEAAVAAHLPGVASRGERFHRRQLRIPAHGLSRTGQDHRRILGLRTERPSKHWWPRRGRTESSGERTRA